MDGTKQHWPGTNSIAGHEQHRQEQTASLGTNSIARNKQHHWARTALARHEQHRSGTGSIGQE
jgi:hypothetical protein